MLISDGIIGPFRATLPVLNDAGEASPTPVGIKIRYRADNDKNWTIVLNRHTQATIEDVLRQAEDEIDATDLKGAVTELSNRLKASAPRMRHDYNNPDDYTLEEVEIDAGSAGTATTFEGEKPEIIASCHDAVLWHTHDPEIGPDADYHSHDIGIKFQIANNNHGKSEAVELTRKMHEKLQVVVDAFFDEANDFSGVTIEDAGARLFKAVNDAIPSLKKGVDETHAYLQAVSITIDYDGTLDHPTQRMEFIRALG